MMMMKLLTIIFLTLPIIQAWPQFKDKQQCSTFKFQANQLDTANVHTECCSGHVVPDPSPRPTDPPVYWPTAFTMGWDFYFVKQNPNESIDSSDCDKKPPYYPHPSPSFNYTQTSGYTYFDQHYRGGAQREQYLDRCIPIWPQFTPDWPCDFINVMNEGRGYLIVHGQNKPKQFGDRCMMGKPFKPPKHDFTDSMNFNGTLSTCKNEKYHSFGIYIANSGGPFAYNFWTDVKKATFERNGVQVEQSYNVPSFFWMLGVESYEWVSMSQQFKDFDASIPSHSVFDIPQACKKDDVGYCPNFDPNQKVYDK